MSSSDRRLSTLRSAIVVLLMFLWLPTAAAADDLCPDYSKVLGMLLSDITEAIAAGPTSCADFDYLADESSWKAECRPSYRVAHRRSEDTSMTYLSWLEHKCDQTECIPLKYEGDYLAAKTSAIPRRFLCD